MAFGSQTLVAAAADRAPANRPKTLNSHLAT